MAHYVGAFVTMKLNLVLLALLQQALCAPQAVDPADLHSALQFDHLDAWTERVAAKRQLSKDAVRSNVRAVTYHLDPDHPVPGGEHAKLERRQKPTKDYPDLYLSEVQNDRITGNRVRDYNGRCRRNNLQPRNSPFTPNNHVFSFWRAVGGGCDGKTVHISCRLPSEFAPHGWNQDARANTHDTTLVCAAGEACTTFQAHNFATGRPSSWGGCASQRTTDRTTKVNGITNHLGYYLCPITRRTSREWDVYAETTDGREVQWTLFTGVEHISPAVSRSPTFMFANTVAWTGESANAQPSLMFERLNAPATIRVYSHVIL